MRRIPCLLVLLAACAPAQESLFMFRNDLRMNLHHFLYVLGRARDRAPDSQRDAVRHAPEDVAGMDALDDAERLDWESAVTAYQRTLSKDDAVFGKEMPAVTRAIGGGGDVPASVSAALERAAPIYRRVWWPRHEAANRERIRELQELDRQHGRPIAAALAKAWDVPWPSTPVVIQVAAYANWAGAYSQDGVILLASLDQATSGTAGLETLFHETLHNWDEQMQAAIMRAASAVGRPAPQSLLHSLIFFSAGYAVAGEIPDYKPYADANGVWARRMYSRDAIQAEWQPYLQGRRSMDEALQALVRGR